MIKESIYDSQEEREKALLVLTNTVTFIQKLMNERSPANEPQRIGNLLSEQAETSKQPS
jgi:hypothetical protein